MTLLPNTPVGRQDDATPSLHGHYSRFGTNTGCSAPVMDIGILACGLRRLRISLGTPCQVPSFHIKACDEIMPPIHRLPQGPQAGIVHAPPGVIGLTPVSTASERISMRHQRFACAHLLNTHLTTSRAAFSPSLTTAPLKRSSMKWFEACPCRPASGGLISHLRYSCAGKYMPASRHTPIGVLHPALHHLLVRKVIDVFEIMQPDHQPRWFRRTADRFEKFPEAFIERRPRHQRRQTNQAMAHVDDRIKALTKKIGIGTTMAGRLHGKTPEIRAAETSSRYYLTSLPVKESRRFNKLNLSSWRTTVARPLALHQPAPGGDT